MNFDPVSMDLPSFDAEYPPQTALITFQSLNEQLLGRMMVAQGKGPHPTILLLHGFPGVEQNFDLAHIFQRAGWNVLTFHYRGAWGSGGNFSFTYLLLEVESALAFIHTPENVTRYRIDENKLVAIGHSMGGFLALMSGTMFPDFKGVASLAGFNFGLFIERLRDNPDALQTLAENWEGELPPLRGTTGKALVKETLISGHQWELTKYASRFTQKSVLLVAASRDTVAPPELHHTPLVDALQKAGTQQLHHHILDSDHGFSDRRVALARLILDWLNTL